MRARKTSEQCERCKLPLVSPNAQRAVPCARCSAYVSNTALALQFMRASFDDVMTGESKDVNPKQNSPPSGKLGGLHDDSELDGLAHDYSTLTLDSLRALAEREMRSGTFTREISLLIDRLDNRGARHG